METINNEMVQKKSKEIINLLEGVSYSDIERIIRNVEKEIRDILFIKKNDPREGLPIVIYRKENYQTSCERFFRKGYAHTFTYHEPGKLRLIIEKEDGNVISVPYDDEHVKFLDEKEKEAFEKKDKRILERDYINKHFEQVHPGLYIRKDK